MAAIAFFSCAYPTPEYVSPARIFHSDVEAALAGCGIAHLGVHVVDMPTRRLMVIAFDAEDPFYPRSALQLAECDGLYRMFVGEDGTGFAEHPNDCVVVYSYARFTDGDPATIEERVAWLDEFAAEMEIIRACKE